MSKFIVGFGFNTNEYTVNGVKYIVESKFIPTNFKDMKSNSTIENRFGKYLKSDFAELPNVSNNDKINAEDMCSAAGKEDNNAVEK